MARVPFVRRRGLSLTEMTIALAIIVVLVAIMIPLIYKALERSRRMACQSNLRTLGQGIATHRDAFEFYPYGARFDAGTNTPGVSWWVEVLPQLGYPQFSQAWKHAPSAGDFRTPTKNPNVALANGFRAPFMFCPSSDLPPLASASASISPANAAGLTAEGISLPMYVAVSGAVPDMLASPGDTAAPGVPLGRNTQDGPYGILSAAGAFPPNGRVSEPGLSDGKGYVIFLVEQSTWGQYTVKQEDDEEELVQFDLRSSGPTGAFQGATGNYGKIQVTAAGINGTGEARCLNITTIRHPINTRAPSAGFVANLPAAAFAGAATKGVNTDGPGHNHGILSAHPGGANALMGDNQVRFLADDTDLGVLQKLGTRDDQKLNPKWD